MNFWRTSETSNDFICSNNNSITLSEIKDGQLEYNIDSKTKSDDLSLLNDVNTEAQTKLDKSVAPKTNYQMCKNNQLS